MGPKEAEQQLVTEAWGCKAMRMTFGKAKEKHSSEDTIQTQTDKLLQSLAEDLKWTLLCSIGPKEKWKKESPNGTLESKWTFYILKPFDFKEYIIIFLLCIFWRVRERLNESFKTATDDTKASDNTNLNGRKCNSSRLTH